MSNDSKLDKLSMGPVWDAANKEPLPSALSPAAIVRDARAGGGVLSTGAQLDRMIAVQIARAQAAGTWLPKRGM